MDPITLLKERQFGLSLRQYARQIGISAPYLSDVYRGNRRPGPKILKYLGLEKIATPVTYKRANGVRK